MAIKAVGRALRLAPAGTGPGFHPRYDIDPFGAVAAAIGGPGWGRPLDVTEVPRHRGRLPAAAVFGAGPVATLLLSQMLLAVHALLWTDDAIILLNPPSAIIKFGAYDDEFLRQAFFCLAVAPLCFAILSLIPIPPLDGFGLLWNAFRVPGPGLEKTRHWLGEKNIGVAILLVLLLFLPVPLLLVIDLVAGPLMMAWT